MSSISKKKKKQKLEEEKRKINEKNKEKVKMIDIPKIKTSYEMLSSINSELDSLFNNMKYKIIFKDDGYNINKYSLRLFKLGIRNNPGIKFNPRGVIFEVAKLINTSLIK